MTPNAKCIIIMTVKAGGTCSFSLGFKGLMYRSSVIIAAEVYTRVQFGHHFTLKNVMHIIYTKLLNFFTLTNFNYLQKC
jgi:hypothetical protein